MFAFLAALVAASAAPAPAAEKAFPFPVEVHSLPNGLRVIFISYDAPGLVAYYTLMRVGSRNEVEKGKSGYAHFFEHMMFRGTKKHPAEEYNQTVTRLGLNTNAFTGEDMTVYHLYGPSKALPTIIEYEADRFQNLSYDEPAFRTEAGAILGEYTKSASNPEQKMFESGVFVMPLNRDGTSGGTAKQITSGVWDIGSLDWTANGREILFAGSAGSARQLCVRPCAAAIRLRP